MKTFLIAAVAVSVSGAAFAKDLKGIVMTDSEMDKVTAGTGFGLDNAVTKNVAAFAGINNGIDAHAKNVAQSAGNPGFGCFTTPNRFGC